MECLRIAQKRGQASGSLLAEGHCPRFRRPGEGFGDALPKKTWSQSEAIAVYYSKPEGNRLNRRQPL